MAKSPRDRIDNMFKHLEEIGTNDKFEAEIELLKLSEINKIKRELITANRDRKHLVIEELEKKLGEPDNSADLDEALQIAIAKIEEDKEFLSERV